VHCVSPRQLFESNEVQANENIRGIPPNPEGSFAAYTSPTIRLPDGSYVMDSLAIADKLEELYPDPPLYHDFDLEETMRKHLSDLFWPIAAEFGPRIPRNILQEPAKSWFTEDRERRFGVSLEQFEKDNGGEKAWPGIAEALEKIKMFYREEKKEGEGPFLRGSQVSYADFLFVATMECMKRLNNETWRRMIEYDEAFGRLDRECEKWTVRDD
jgi:glutathione S-transferase